MLVRTPRLDARTRTPGASRIENPRPIGLPSPLRSPGADRHGRARPVAEDRLVVGVVPDVGATVLVAVGGGVAAVPGVDAHALARTQRERAEAVDVAGGVPQRP